jgi:hypothetical protein
MVNSHCSLIAHRLLEGGLVTEDWLHSFRIRNQHKRLDTISYETYWQMSMDSSAYKLATLDFKATGPFFPILNIGSVDGHPFKLKNGSVTRCGCYVLPKKFRPALKKAIKRMNW